MVKESAKRLSGENVRRVFYCMAIQVVSIPVVLCALPNFWEYLSVQFSVGLYCAIWFVEACIVAAMLCIGMGMSIMRANLILFFSVDVSCFLSSLIVWLTAVAHV